jgi:hypothetical protein
MGKSYSGDQPPAEVGPHAFGSNVLYFSPPRRASKPKISSFLAGTSCVFLSITLCIVSTDFLHWFLIPVTLCGALITSDAVSLLSGGKKIYEPAVLLSVYGIYFFFLAPLLNVYWDYWLIYSGGSPDDWRPWLGGVATFNLVGIVVYKWFRNRYLQKAKMKPSGRIWLPQREALFSWFLIVLPLALGCQIWAYARFGGVGGYIDAFEFKTSENFAGLGPVFAIAETFPVLLFIALCIFVFSKRRRVDMLTISIALGIVLALSIFFGGLRGSRTLIVDNVLWAAGIVHFTLRPLSKRAILAGICVIVVFMYAYGFYKQSGARGLDYLLSDRGEREQAAEESGRTVNGLLLGDLARSGVQSYVLYRLWKPDSDYQYAMGSTYLGALTLFIPAALRPRILTTNEAGMNMAYGQGTFIEGTAGATYVYGLAGEAMLNFTPWAIPISFALLGIFVGYLQRWLAELPRGDVRWYLAPPLAVLSVSVLTGSSDNLVYWVSTTLTLPALLLLSTARKVPVQRINHRMTRSLEPISS